MLFRGLLPLMGGSMGEGSEHNSSSMLIESSETED
jgi:hypothetical protein